MPHKTKKKKFFLGKTASNLKIRFSVGERGRVTNHAKTVGILVRVVEDSSDVAATVKLLTYIASYESQ